LVRKIRDLEWRNGHYFVLFQQMGSFGRALCKMVEDIRKLSATEM